MPLILNAHVDGLNTTCALTTVHRRVECTDDEFGWSRFNVRNADSATALAISISRCWVDHVLRPYTSGSCRSMKTSGRLSGLNPNCA